MDISKESYFFYEWLYIEKKFTEEKLLSITEEEWKEILLEYQSFKNNLNS